MRWIGRLGYGGCADRREFAAGAALTMVGPLALSMASNIILYWLLDHLPRIAALIVLVVLTLIVCAAILGWFWLWSTLLTRRARDLGLPAWAGVASVFVLMMALPGLAGLFAQPFADAVAAGVVTVWLVGWAIWPGAGRPWLPRRQPPEASAAA